MVASTVDHTQKDRYVGGGFVRRAKLRPDERLLKSGDARCRWRYWLTSWGSLFLTNERLIYCPSIFFLRRPFSIPLSKVRDAIVMTSVQSNLDMPSKIRIETSDGLYDFGFGIYGWNRRNEWASSIRAAANSVRET